MKALQESIGKISIGKLLTQVVMFKDMNLNLPDLPDDVDLVNSSYSLPYVGKDFPKVWTKIVARLRKGGIFAGQLFGPTDDLKAFPKITLHSSFLDILENKMRTAC